MVALAKADNLHILLSSKSNEWYTPSLYVEAARRVMGSIELDPGSCAEANIVVKANQFYTKEDNGLAQEWFGNVWLNPPYGTTNGKSNQGIWARKLIAEYDAGRVVQAVLLCNALTDTKWFHALFRFPICFTEGRVNFYTSSIKVRVGITHGSCFVYLGSNVQKFTNTFKEFGTVIPGNIAVRKYRPINLSLWEGL